MKYRVDSPVRVEINDASLGRIEYEAPAGILEAHSEQDELAIEKLVTAGVARPATKQETEEAGNGEVGTHRPVRVR